MILAIVLGDALIESGVIKNPLQYQTPAKIVFFTLFIVFGFSLIPLMVRLVLAGLESIGKSLNIQPFAPLIARPGWIVWPIWLLMASGVAVALPAAIRAGFFGPDAGAQATAHDSAAEAIAKMPSRGTLVAAPDMAVAAMLADSTLEVQRGSTSALFSGAQFGAPQSSTIASRERQPCFVAAATITSRRTGAIRCASRRSTSGFRRRR